MYVANPFRRLVIPSEVEESLIIDRQEMSRVALDMTEIERMTIVAGTSEPMRSV